MPLSVQEYRIGQLYMVVRVSERESDNSDGDGVEVLCNEPFSRRRGGGIGGGGGTDGSACTAASGSSKSSSSRDSGKSDGSKNLGVQSEGTGTAVVQTGCEGESEGGEGKEGNAGVGMGEGEEREKGGVGTLDPAGDTEEGYYTHKIYHLNKKLPAWIAALVPRRALRVEERAWNAYPHCVTAFLPHFCFSFHPSAHSTSRLLLPIPPHFRLSIPAFPPPSFSASLPILPILLLYPSLQALSLPPDMLAHRTVETLDIAEGGSEEGKTGREREGLRADGRCAQLAFNDSLQAYKVVTVDVPCWGFGSRLEKYLAKVLQRRLSLETNQAVVCWMDEWIGLSEQQVRAMEEHTFSRINQELKARQSNQR
ncbi:unnamed protein product [Closterium sp. NIES-65]|nr:unnamed protein product [Closterium sp. NIES-65]